MKARIAVFIASALVLSGCITSPATKEEIAERGFPGTDVYRIITVDPAQGSFAERWCTLGADRSLGCVAAPSFGFNTAWNNVEFSDDDGAFYLLTGIYRQPSMFYLGSRVRVSGRTTTTSPGDFTFKADIKGPGTVLHDGDRTDAQLRETMRPLLGAAVDTLTFVKLEKAKVTCETSILSRTCKVVD